MSGTKKYFHDHLVLLLLSINSFLAVAGSALVLIRLSANESSSVFVQFRDTPGINEFKTGSVAEILSFVAFAFLVLAVHTMLSLSAYRIHRQLAIAILSLGILLLILMIIVSNALLELH